MNSPFFSFVIPAYNEEQYIGNTLAQLALLQYPHDRYEVIVVENGSTDNTRGVVEAHPIAKLISVPEAGVSGARNIGAHEARVDSDWIIFLDADTYVGSTFLTDVSEFLHAHASHKYVIGTASLWPWPHTMLTFVLYAFSNIGFWVRRAPYEGLLLVKRNIVNNTISFDEKIKVGEGFRFIDAARTEGKFFFLWTANAHTSTRRFVRNGGWKMIPVWVGMWLFARMVPIYVQRRFEYKAIR